MPYYLHIYALPENMAKRPLTAAEAPAFIAANGMKMGEIGFGAGESTLFARAFEDLTGVPIHPLFRGSVGNVAPRGDDVAFGSIADVSPLVHGISRFLNGGGPGQLSAEGLRKLRDLDNKYTLEPNDTLDKIRKLDQLLTRIHSMGAMAAGVYE
jgi:hypothetical protein